MNGFSRTLRAIERERSGLYTVLVGIVLVLVAAWAAWLVFAKTTLYVVSESGRLEATRSPLPVQAPVDGVVVSSDLALGRRVAEGDILFAIDSKSFELQKKESEAKLENDRDAVTALERQVVAEEQARSANEQNVVRGTSAAQAKVLVAVKSSEAKARESEILNRLAEASLASKLDNLRTQAEAEQTSAQAKATRAEAALTASSGQTELRDRDVRIATLAQQLTSARGQVKLDEAKLATLTYEIERRTVRATASGILADVVALPAGSTLMAAQKVATIVPVGAIRVVAQFPPDQAIGRIEPGQKAQLRLDNFPWTQYGTVEATVAQVGNEPRDGTVRIELDIAQTNPRIPVVHGLTGTAEVEVEQLSPARLLLRLAGQQLSPLRQASASPVAGTRVTSKR